MGQTKYVPHCKRRDEPRTRMRAPIPMARRDTILASIEALLLDLARPDATHAERKAGQERLQHLRRLAGM